MQEKKDQKAKKPSNQPNPFLRYSGMALQMALIIGLGVFGGQALDEKLNKEFPLFTLIFSILAVALAMYMVIKDLSK